MSQLDPSVLNDILSLQLAVAWAGERNTDPPRLGWWRTAMADEFGGEDLLKRLTPRTWEWAVLEAAREAAKRVDNAARERGSDADQLVSLFRLGFELDERIDDRLREWKQSGQSPRTALRGLTELLGSWSKESFERFLQRLPEAAHSPTATGRRIRGDMPTEPRELVQRLAAALLPLHGDYPLPHYKKTA